MDLDRRTFVLDSARLAAWFAVFQLGVERSAFASALAPNIERWSRSIEDLCDGVLAGKVAPIAWQQSIAELHSRIPLEDIVRFVDLDRVLATLKPPERKLGAVQDVSWPRRVRFGHKLFVYRKGAMTPPHAHNELVSAHLVLRGEIRARTYDRIEDRTASMLIEPTGDAAVTPGQTVTMSSQRHNVHWFEGLTDVSVSLDVPVGGISRDPRHKLPAEGYNQIFIDPTGRPSSAGRIDAPVIPFAESVKRFA